MRTYVIMCVSLEELTRNNFSKDLTPLGTNFSIVATKTLEEAHQIIENIKLNNGILCTLFYEPQPDSNQGIDFLIDLSKDNFTKDTRKILLSGDSGKHEIIEAVNNARLDFYFQQPWKPEKLMQLTIDQTTTYIINHVDEVLPFAKILDSERLIKSHVNKKLNQYQSELFGLYTDGETPLSSKILESLSQYFEDKSDNTVYFNYSPKEYLIKEGERNNYIWFIISGEIALEKRDSDGLNHSVMLEKAGSIVGVLSFLTNDSAFVSAYATKPTETLRFDNKMFSEVMKTRTKLLPMFTNLLLHNLTERIKKRISTEMKLQETLKSLNAVQSQLIESEKMAMLGELVAGVAHELNNPISAILRGAENLETLIPNIIKCDTLEHLKALGVKTLLDAMTMVPQSTTEIRTRTQQSLSLYKSRNLTRKAVQMNLDNPDSLALLGSNVEAAIRYLDSFYKTGSALRSISVCGVRISNMVKGLKNYSRPALKVTEMANINIGLEDTLVLFESKLKNLEVTKEYGDLPLIKCYPNEIQQVWTNFINNAIDATNQQGKIKIITEKIIKNDCPFIKVTVEDDGPGIPAQLHEKIFEYNYTTKHEGNFGLGIGLAVCKQIVNCHNGSIEIDSQLGKYTRFIVYLPYTI